MATSAVAMHLVAAGALDFPFRFFPLPRVRVRVRVRS